jgi:hypothetical protein
MSICPRLIFASAAALMVFAWSAPSHALTAQECSAKYKAAKSEGTLKGMRWNEFRRTQCGTNASAAAPAATATSPAPSAQTRTTPAPSAQTRTTSTPSTVGIGSAVFPSAVSQKYASEAAGRARMHTCRDQYNANKTSNGNAGLKWIQKGGGYYSECNRRLSQR